MDTDFARRRRTRKSTSGGYTTRGTHLIKSWATTQTVIAMSSGEAEYCGVVKGTYEAVGICELASRLVTLWLQEQVGHGLIRVVKIAGHTNPADACTKYF